MGEAILCLSSMATRGALAELLAGHAPPARLEAVGGVEAARRVRAGEAFDVVALAETALAALEAEGFAVAGSRLAFALSAIALAVPAGAPAPDMTDADAVRTAVLAAPRVAYSTGPSGDHVLRLLRQWGARPDAPRLVRAPPGVPVAALLARGEADLGFQQTSELIGQPGIAIAGALPDAIQQTTVFAMAVAASSRRPQEAAALIAFLAGPQTAAVKRRHGLTPP